MRMIEVVWDLLGKKTCLVFGKECGSACIWMIFSLIVRATIILIGLEQYIPCGVVFAFPYFIQILGTYLPLVNEIFPILTNRLTDSLLGRVSPARLFVTIPAHFLGCVFGTVMIKVLLPILPSTVFEPVSYDPQFWLQNLIKESVVTCVYICVTVALPELLEVNRLPSYLMSVPILILSMVNVPDKGSMFNPAALYALWYVHGQTSGQWNFQAEHFIGPIFGAIAAGTICSKLFPDDPGSWRKGRPGLHLL